MGGLDRIHTVRGINFCLDFSDTPFYIKGSGYPEGDPFPWIISDSGLVDTIESGIVKIPLVSVDDNTDALIPKYFRLWEHINRELPASERQTARRRAKPESVLREVVLDAPTWEHSVAYQLEQMPEAIAYAHNDHLNFAIPYEWPGVQHEYRPDYLIRLRGKDGKEITVVLEVKGFETEQDRQKETAAQRWVRAINHHGEFGRWQFAVCKEPRDLNLKGLFSSACA